MENIDIGSFNFDTNKLTDKIAANRKQMDAWKKTISEAKKSITESTKEIGILEQKIESERKAQERLSNQLQKGYITQEKYNSEISKSNDVLDKFVEESLKLSNAQAQSYISINKNEQAVKDLRLENNELNKYLANGQTELTGFEFKLKEYRKALSASKAEVSNLELALYELEKQGKKDTDQFRYLSEQLKFAKEKNDELTKAVKKAEESSGEFFRSVGQYKDSIVSASAEITTGFMQMAKGEVIAGFTAIKTGIRGIATEVKALSVSLLTNPVTAILVGIGAVATGLVLGFKEVLKYNEQVRVQTKFLQDKFGDLGSQADELRNKINAVGETYGLQFERIGNTVDTISSSGLATQVEAIDAIAKGLSTAPNADEFLSKLDLAASKARQTGMNLEQVINLTKALQGTAIKPDTIYGQLEKATNALQKPLSENNKLIELFGKGFTEKLLKDLKDGTINTVDALTKIDEKGRQVNINAEQQAQLGKELFGKLGANAGAYLENMRLANEAQKDQFANLTDLQKKTIDLYNANLELEQAQDKALKSDAIIALKYEWEQFWKSLKTGFYNFIAWIRNATTEFDASAEYMNGVFRSLPKAASNAFKAIVNALSELVSSFRAGGGAISSFFKGDFEKASAEADKFLTGHSRFAANLLKIGSDFGSELNKAGVKQANEFRKQAELRTKAEAEAQRKIDELKKKNSNYDTRTDGDVKAAKDAEKKKKEAEKALKDEARKEAEMLKNRAENASKYAQLELAEYIQSNAKKYDSDKALTDKKLKDQLAYYDEIQKIQQKAYAEEEKSKLITAKTAEEKDVIKREFALKDKELTAKTEEEKAKIQKDYDSKVLEQKKLLRATEYQQRLLELDQQGATEAEKQRLQLEQQTTDKLLALFNENEALRQFREDAYITDQEVEAARRELQDQINAERDVNEQMRLQAQLNTLNNIEIENSKLREKITELETSKRLSEYGKMFGGIAKLLGENTAAGKAAGIAQATINTYQGVTEVWKTESSLPEPFATISKVVNTGVVLASGLGAVQKIASVKTPSGYADGGLISDGYEIQRSNGDNRLITAKTGEVILNERQQALLGGAPVFSAIGVPGFARGGIVTSSSPTIQNSIVNNNINVEAMADILRQAVMDGAESGSHSGSRSGISESAENAYIASRSNF